MASMIKNISRMNLGLSAGPVFLGDVTYKAGGSCGPRRQGDYQLVVIHRGECDLRLDQRRVHLSAGEAILLSPRHREHFLFSRTAETRHSWCSVHPRAVPRPLRRAFGLTGRPVRFGERMTTLFEWAQTHGGPGDETLRGGFFSGLALALLCDFALLAREEIPAERAAPPALIRLGIFIRREFARPLSLGDLARAAGVSPQYLLKLCRARKLPRPMQQLYARRLEAAADALARTGVPVGEVAERCGFANAFHFSRRFRQAYGRSPLAWRKRIWGASPKWHGDVLAARMVKAESGKGVFLTVPQLKARLRKNRP
jgi:AraC-like DNA-binding protein